VLLNYLAPCSAMNLEEVGTRSSSLVCSKDHTQDLTDGECAATCPNPPTPTRGAGFDSALIAQVTVQHVILVDA